MANVPSRPHDDGVGVPPRVRRSWIHREELVERLRAAQADPGLRTELARLAADTTADLGPIR